MSIRWVTCCALCEAAGIAAVAGAYAAFDRGVLAAPAWILMAGVWEGLVLGAGQGLMLSGAGVRPGRWIGMTVAAAAMGYGLSVLGSAGVSAPTAADPPLPLIVMGGAALGSVMGLIMGACQALAARDIVNAPAWILANALGWTPAMAVIMLAASGAGAGWPLWSVAGLGAVSGALAGAMVGAATSYALPAPLRV